MMTEIPMAAVTPLRPTTYQLPWSQSVMLEWKYPPLWLIWTTSYPTWNTDKHFEELHDCASQQWGFTKNTNSAELDISFSSIWACNYFALCSSFQSVLVVSVAVELQGHAGQLVGFWLQDLCVRRAKSWMEVIMCNLPICLHVIWKPWINNFIQATIS